MGPIWQAQLGNSLVVLIGPSWAPKFIALLGNKFGAQYGKGPSIKYVTLFLANFDPPLPITLCHTSRDPPPKVRHTSRTPPIFSRPSTKIPDKTPLYKFYLNCSQRFMSGGFCPGWFLSVPPSVTIHLLQQKVK